MKFIYQLILVGYLLVGTIFSTQAEEKMNQQQLSRYFAIIECVTANYYDGGYDPEDTNRISFMTAMLAYYDLPSYSEEIYDQMLSGFVLDREAYMDIYMKCISDEDDILSKTAAKYGVEEPNF